ncbi:hypothetical protein EJB05_51287, partial [Eragrostis curvula]
MKRSRREKEAARGEITLGNGGGYDDCSILRLPEACLAHVISLLTPTDACCSSAVSSTFQAVASSDTVWECFLPPGYRSMLARADHPVDFTSTKKELFLSLAQDHILLDQGTKSFWLERTSGAKCYMLSSRSVTITWVDNPVYWRRIYLPDSRFEEATELLAVCWFDVFDSFECKELSPNKKYAAYLVFNLADESCGLGYCPTQEAFIYMGDQIVSAKRVVSFYPPTATQGTRLCSSDGGSDSGMDRRGDVDEGGGPAEDETIPVSYPSDRDDGWMEVELGEFYNHHGDIGEMVSIRLTEIVQLHWKKGIVFGGHGNKTEKLDMEQVITTGTKSRFVRLVEAT